MNESQRREEELTEELRQAQAEIEHFAYVASHDLREPLRTIAGFSQLLERRSGEKLDAKDREYLHYIGEGVERMQALIDDLLLYSRAARAEQPPGPVALDPVLDRVLEQLRPALQQAGAELQREPLPTVRGREDQLQLVLSALLDNALKFRADRPLRLTVAATAEDGYWRISVSDNGIGIAPQQRERIFGIFNRLHGRGDYPGSGMGLAVARKIIERLGGQIWVESEPEVGSRFQFTLPAVSPPENLSDNS